MRQSLKSIDRKRLEQLVQCIGEKEAIARVGLDRSTFARCLAGLSVHRGTVSHVRAVLDAAALGGTAIDGAEGDAAEADAAGAGGQ
jgi:hypothetical protein